MLPRKTSMAPRCKAYLFSALAVGTALALRFALNGWLMDRSPYPIFLIAVAATALYAGVGASVAAAAMGALAADYFFVPPKGQLRISTIGDVVALCVYLGAAAAILALAKARTAGLDKYQSLYASAKELREQLEAIVEAAPAAIVMFARDRTVTVWNRAAERLFGWSSDEIMGKPLPVPASAQGQWESIEQNLRAGIPTAKVETVRARKDGSEIDVLLSDSPLLDSRGNLKGFVGVMVDASELVAARRRLESTVSALRMSEQRIAAQEEALELAVGNAPLARVLETIVAAVRKQVGEDARTAIFLVDKDGARLRFAVSAGMSDAYTRAMDGFEIRPDNPACGSVAYTGIPSVVQDVAEDPLWRPYLPLARQHDICACWSFPICSLGADPLGTLAIYHRARRSPTAQEIELISLFSQTAALVIQKNRLEDDYRRAEEALRSAEALAATGRMAHALAHQINNPLQAVTSLLYLLEQDSTLSESSHQWAACASAELVRVSQITKQALSLYSGGKQLHDTDLCALLDTVVDALSQQIASKHILIERRYRWSGQVELLQKEIQEAFWNVLANALHAADAGGRILIRVCPAREPSGACRRGIRVTIAGNGGIGNETQKKLLEPVAAAQDCTHPGLGLWVVHDIVARHGGALRIRSSSRPGRSGTCCTIFLPLSSPPRKGVSSSRALGWAPETRDGAIA